MLRDASDSGRRQSGDVVGLARLEPRAAARSALFQYMIGNRDWSMKAGLKGEGCCHNSRLFAATGAAAGSADLLTIPYDFDYAGLVDAPYAVPPDGSNVSVRLRLYRGYCRHNREALAAAAEFRALRPALLGELATIPGLDERSRRRASAYIDAFFADIASDERMTGKVLAKCLN